MVLLEPPAMELQETLPSLEAEPESNKPQASPDQTTLPHQEASELLEQADQPTQSAEPPLLMVPLEPLYQEAEPPLVPPVPL